MALKIGRIEFWMRFGFEDYMISETGLTKNNQITIGLILATNPDDYMNTFAPIGLGYVGASIKENLPGVKVIYNEQIDKLLAQNPDVVGIGSASDTYHLAIEFAKRVKKKLNVPVVIGGIHISLLPDSLHETFDVAVIGEAEVTIVELIKSYMENRGFVLQKLEKINGLAFRNDGKLQITPPREVIKDLDDLSHPAIEELPYYNPSASSGICLITSRGCPYRCSFCCSRKFSSSYRAFSAEYVANLIDYWVHAKNRKYIVLYDDLLIANKRRLISIIEKLEQRGIPQKCEFNCQVRANLINDEMCLLLNRMNVTAVGMGVESFSDRVLRFYNKSKSSGSINQKAIDCLNKHGIRVGPSIIIGAPIETEDEIKLTLKTVYSNFIDGKIHQPGWGFLKPYPGTEIWEYAYKKGHVGPEMNWKAYSKEIYLGEMVPKQGVYEICEEWITKNSILLNNNREIGGNFVHDDAEKTWRSAQYFYETIKNRDVKELGDEKLISFVENPIQPRFIEGFYDGEKNDEYVLTDSSTLLVRYFEDVDIIVYGYIPRKFFKSSFDKELEITVLFPDDTIIARHLVNKENSRSGAFNFRFTLPKSDYITVKIRTDQSVVPKLANLGEDERNIAFFVRKLEVVTA